MTQGAGPASVTDVVAQAPEARAIAHIAQRAAQGSDAARATIARILARHGDPESLARNLAESIARHARVTLNFHPDRIRTDGLTVAEGLLRDGAYLSQFDTGVTNGSPTAFVGGERDRWEELLFGGAYNTDSPSEPVLERPKYGALDVMSHSDGGSPRFGSCYFVLRRSMLAHCTFSWGDSHEGPEHVGTITRLEAVMAALLEAVDTTGTALGVGELDVSALLARLSDASHYDAQTNRPPGRALDDYVEAQVHGPIVIARDIEALVIDPAFDGTETGAHLGAISAQYGFTLRRHRGFVLLPSEVPPDFRGPQMPTLAARISGGAEFDAATLGRAARSLHDEPQTWSDWDTSAGTWQDIKRLWHVLVRFGRERTNSPLSPPAA
ncbi:MAG: DUF3626 domain-containing protein [Polyangiaceae bacterium]